ncbi:AI-2E family transporter [Methylonatrum kenyense]|uniref:AI-2E family transporter n=1 Tax=Methylonatrum kenyense TaxID=455253 RepID=UPI0020BF04DA|nr:AI-2E family transporter [Methylonatrum kenyense]MCK8516898.1 AI-2E family transporter [Methylonatrum kenyense]
MAEQGPPSLFSQTERKLLRVTAMLATGVVLAGLIVLIVWVLAQLMATFYGILLPLSVAGVMALVLFPVVDALEEKLRIGRLPAVILLFVVFLGLIALGLTVVLPTAVSQLAQFFDDAPDTFSRWQNQFATRFPDLAAMVTARMDEDDLGDLLPEMDDAREQLMGYLETLVGLAFVPLFLFFALLSGRRMQKPFDEALQVFREETRKDILYLSSVFISYVTGFFRGQLIIAMIMGVLLAAGFTLAGLQAAIPIGLFLGLLNIVPFLGIIIGLIVTVPMAYLQPSGGADLVLYVLLVFAVVQLIESWILTPKIMADRSGLHPALVVISIFFWGIALGGIIGMILAVPLTAFVITLWRHLSNRFMSQVMLDEQTAETLYRPPDNIDEP